MRTKSLSEIRRLSRLCWREFLRAGVEIAQRVAAFIREIENDEIETGVIDVAMHRDDVGTRAGTARRARVETSAAT